MSLTPIQEFYKDKTVFLTGTTGFLGQSILEKLLRTCRDIKRVYVLVRPKKTLNSKERLENLISDKLFDRIKVENPDFVNKITIMNGDLLEDKLGICDEDINTFINEINIVIHSAATVKFDEKLEIAIKLNTCSAKYLLELTKKCIHFESYVHISTAYSNSYLSSIEEKFYDPVADPNEIIDYVNKTSSEEIQKQKYKIISPHPNTYTFTKCLAENIVKVEGKGLPVCIVRPSIVFGAYNEPYPGWAGNNLAGPFGFMTGCGAGILRVVKMAQNKVTDYIPVDMVTNSIIAAGYDTAQKTKHDEVNIYNLVSGNSNPITGGESFTWLLHFCSIYPPINSLWTPSLYCVASTFGYNILKLFLHTIPGYIFDLFYIIMRKKPQFTKLYQKVHSANETASFFMLNEWDFSDKNTRKLYFSLTDRDQKLFNFDIEEIKWDIYCLDNLKQIRSALLNEPLSTVSAGRKQAKWRNVINLTIIVLFLYYVHNIYSLIVVMAIIIFVNLFNI